MGNLRNCLDFIDNSFLMPRVNAFKKLFLFSNRCFVNFDKGFSEPCRTAQYIV